MINTITIDGRLAKDPELRFTGAGKAALNMRLGHTPRMKNASGEWVDGETVWLDVTLWSNDSEHAAQQLSKGDLVIVAGRLRARAYELNGASRTALDVTAESVGLVRKSGAPKATAHAPADAPWDSEPQPW